MANNHFEPDALTWSRLFLHCIRFIIPCAVILSSLSINTVFHYTIRMQTGSKTGGQRHSNGSERPRSRDHPSNRHATRSPGAADASNFVPRHTDILRDSQHHQPPPPYSVDPPNSESKVQHESIMRLYEEIMASDSETIKTQQSTLESQQEVVRSQAQIIKQMRDIVEMQDAQIIELEDIITNLREGMHCGRHQEVSP